MTASSSFLRSPMRCRFCLQHQVALAFQSEDNQDSAQSGDPSVPPTPTSRISVKHVVEIIQTFNEFKRFLVTSIGFGGMLDLQKLQKLNLKFTSLKRTASKSPFIIFVMGYILAPTTKHDYTTIDFWGALANTEIIEQFNWCEYVIQCFLAGVTRLKNDMLSNNPGTNLVGCHLSLRIFLLDNLDHGMFNKEHSVLLRVSQFDQDSLPRMITMATDVGKLSASYAYTPFRHHSTVCYARSKHSVAEQSATLRQGTLQNH